MRGKSERINPNIGFRTVFWGPKRALEAVKIRSLDYVNLESIIRNLSTTYRGMLPKQSFHFPAMIVESLTGLKS